jgi:hypothetical protein
LKNGCKIYLLEEYPCCTRKDLDKREGWYQLNNPCANKRIAGGMGSSNKKYYQANKEKMKAYCREKVECELCKSIVSRIASMGTKGA